VGEADWAEYLCAVPTASLGRADYGRDRGGEKTKRGGTRNQLNCMERHLQRYVIQYHRFTDSRKSAGSVGVSWFHRSDYDSTF
jgi:hypothetical protein